MSEECDAIDDDLRAAIARLKGHPVQKAMPQPVSEIYPFFAAAEAKKAAEEAAKIPAWLEAEKDFWASLRPGDLLLDGTIYLCKYSPTDRAGNSLGKIFNVLAAPQDLQKDGEEAWLTYDETVEHLSTIRGLCGYDGAAYKNDSEIYQALRDGSYGGEWVIPTRDILSGMDADGNPTIQDNIEFVYKRNKGSFAKTFNFMAWHDKHWSSTETKNAFYCMVFVDALIPTPDGYKGPANKNWGKGRCRPVRLVPCK